MKTKMRAPTVRVSLDMSPEANELLENLAIASCTTKSQILRRAVALYDVVVAARSQGKRVVVLDQSDKLVSEFVGL